MKAGNEDEQDVENKPMKASAKAAKKPAAKTTSRTPKVLNENWE